MKLETLWTVATSGRVRAMGSVLGLANAHYRLVFLVAAAKAGLLRLLAAEPRSSAAAAEAQGLPENARTAFAAWLDVGVALGELSLDGDRLALASPLARALAVPENDDLLAMMDELQSLHTRLARDTPVLLARGERLTLDDQDGEVIARSSRLLEPFVEEAIALAVPKQGACRVLEVGCGSGVYLRFMAERNPQLTARGVELQPKVAEAAAKNLAAWGVEGRVSVAAGDVRGLAPDERYDVVTLHNNIYYFEEAARTEVLRGLLARLVPGGTLLVTTACRGGSAAIAMLNLWGAMTQGCGRLPTSEELSAQLRDAGAVEVRAHHVGAPVQSFWAFTAKAPR